MKTNRVLSAILAFVMIMSMIPFGVMSVSAETVKLSGSGDVYEFTSDSWETGETTALTTTDGKTFTDVAGGASGASVQSAGGKITTVDKFDLSDGFAFSVTLSQYGINGNKWGDAVILDFAAFQIVLVGSFGTSDSRHTNTVYYIGSGYSAVSNGNPTFETLYGKYDTGIGIYNGTAATEEQMATLNTTFEVVYKDGNVSLYVESMKSDTNELGMVEWTVGETTATGIAIDSAKLAEVNISIQKNWSYVDDLDVLKDIALVGVDSDFHEHVFTNYADEVKATCTETGAKIAVCDVEGCEETDVEEIESLGHDWGAWNVDDAAGVKTRTCNREGCGEVDIVPTRITVNVGDVVDFTEASWKVTAGQNVTTTDGKTYSMAFDEAKRKEADGVVGYSMGGITVESADKYDLSEGFVFTVDTHLLARIGGVWGANDDDGNASKIKIGNFELRFWYTWTKPELYIVAYNNGQKIGQSTYKYKWLSGSNGNDVVNKTEEDVSFVNTTFTIEYKYGKLSVYKASLVTESNPTGLVKWDNGVTSFAIDPSAFTNSQFYLKKGWSFIEQNEIFANLTLRGIDPHEHVFETEYEKGEDGNWYLRCSECGKLIESTKLEAPAFFGVQEATADGRLNVRFVGEIDSLIYDTVGFEISVPDSDKVWTRDNIRKVYKTVVGSSVAGITEEYTADEGNFLYALTILGAASDVTFKVRTVATYEGDTLYGTEYTVVYSDGAFVSITPDIDG